MLGVLDRLLVVEDPEDHLRKVGGLVSLPAIPRVGLAEGDLESTIGTRDRHPDRPRRDGHQPSAEEAGTAGPAGDSSA